MARSYAPIVLSVWRNDDFLALDSEAQRLYFLLISQPSMDYCGVIPYMPSRWSKLAKGSTMPRVKRAANDLETAGFVAIDRNTEELWVRSFVKHNAVLSQPNITKAMRSAFENIASLPIRQAFYVSLPLAERKHLPSPFPPNDPHTNGKTEPQGEPLAEPFGEGQREPQASTQGLGTTEVSSGFDLDPNLQPKPGPSSSSQAEADDDDDPPEWAYLEAKRRLALRPPHLPVVLDPAAWLRSTAADVATGDQPETDHERDLRIAEEVQTRLRGAS